MTYGQAWSRGSLRTMSRRRGSSVHRKDDSTSRLFPQCLSPQTRNMSCHRLDHQDHLHVHPPLRSSRARYSQPANDNPPPTGFGDALSISQPSCRAPAPPRTTRRFSAWGNDARGATLRPQRRSPQCLFLGPKLCPDSAADAGFQHPWQPTTSAGSVPRCSNNPGSSSMTDGNASCPLRQGPRRRRDDPNLLPPAKRFARPTLLSLRMTPLQ